MVELNERAKEYLSRVKWQHVVLNIEEITSWCAPPYLEVAVSFTDEDEEAMLAKGYQWEQSELGKVYYPSEGVVILDKICVNYMEYPWISCFEVEGVEIEKKEWEDRAQVLYNAASDVLSLIQ